MSTKKLTLDQEELVSEFVTTYGLDADQISFEGEKTEPIFDFDALCLLREKLTDFTAVDASAVDFDHNKSEAQAVCTIVCKNGNVVTVSDFAELGEPMPDGTFIQNSIQAKRVARARAMRTGIRTAGVNIVKAHRSFVETGEISDSEPVNPRIAKTKEVHVLAGKIGLILGADKREYHRYLAEMFDGRTSSTDLDDLELQRLIVSLRAINRLNLSKTVAAEKLAA